MIIGIPRESLPGETRVAATPQTVGQLIKLGYEVVVESGAGAASSFSDAAFTRGRRRRRIRRAGLGGRRGAQGERAERRGDRRPARRRHPDQPDLPRAQAGARRAAGHPADHRAGHGRRSAHLPGPVAGRAVVDGEHRGLPRRHRGRPRVRPVLHRAGDRGGQGAAGQGARRRRGRGRPGRDRRGGQPRRHRARHRPAARGRRSGQIARRGVPFDRVTGGRGVGHRLRQGDGRRLQGPRGAAVRRAGQATSTSSSPPR